MKVFACWSGELSKRVALAMKECIPLMLPDVSIFLSESDIESGTRWPDRLRSELSDTNYGIVCLTPDNQLSPWILFESGALSKTDPSHVCGLLLGGLSKADVTGPLASFQHRECKRDDVLKLVQDLNALCEGRRPDRDVQLVFDAFWPRIETHYKQALEAAPPPKKIEREVREIVEETLNMVRDIARRGAPAPAPPAPTPPTPPPSNPFAAQQSSGIPPAPGFSVVSTSPFTTGANFSALMNAPPQPMVLAMYGVARFGGASMSPPHDPGMLAKLVEVVGGAPPGMMGGSGLYGTLGDVHAAVLRSEAALAAYLATRKGLPELSMPELLGSALGLADERVWVRLGSIGIATDGLAPFLSQVHGRTPLAR